MLKKLMMIVLCAFTAIAISGCFSNEPDISGIYIGARADKPETIIIELIKGSNLKEREYKNYKDGYVVNIYTITPTGKKFLEREVNKGYALPPDKNGIIGVYSGPDAQKHKSSTTAVLKLQEDGNLLGVTGKGRNPFYKNIYSKQAEKSVDELSNRLKSEHRNQHTAGSVGR